MMKWKSSLVNVVAISNSVNINVVGRVKVVYYCSANPMVYCVMNPIWSTSSLV